MPSQASGRAARPSKLQRRPAPKRPTQRAENVAQSVGHFIGGLFGGGEHAIASLPHVAAAVAAHISNAEHAANQRMHAQLQARDERGGSHTPIGDFLIRAATLPYRNARNQWVQGHQAPQAMATAPRNVGIVMPSAAMLPRAVPMPGYTGRVPNFGPLATRAGTLLNMGRPQGMAVQNMIGQNALAVAPRRRRPRRPQLYTGPR